MGEPGIDGDGVFFRNSRVKLAEVTDGTATTILAGERAWPHSETVWAGVVPNAGFAPPAGSPLPMQVDDAASFVLGHTGEMLEGPAVPTEVNSYSSHHWRSSNYLFCDGHVRVLTGATSYRTLNALATRAGGEVISGEAGLTGLAGAATARERLNGQGAPSRSRLPPIRLLHP